MLVGGFVLSSVALNLALMTVLLASAPPQPGQKSGSLNDSISSPQADALVEAHTQIQNGKWGEAERTLRSYLTAHQNSGDAHFLLGYVLFEQIHSAASLQGRTDPSLRQSNAKAALAEFTEGAKYRPARAFELKIVAMCDVLLGDYADADTWLTKSVGLNPQDAEGWYYLGRAKYNEQKFDEATRAFMQCLRLDPGNVKAEDNMGLAYAALERYDEAVAAYHTAIGWQTDSLMKDSGPYIDLGNLLLQQNRASEAIPYLKQGVTISPQESRAHAALGKAYFKTDSLPEARGELEKAVQLAPDNASLHYVLGQVYRKLGLPDKAKLEFDRTAQLNGSHSSPVNDLRSASPHN
jgi:tetratricopeptide (TPR) repeat protein